MEMALTNTRCVFVDISQVLSILAFANFLLFAINIMAVLLGKGPWVVLVEAGNFLTLTDMNHLSDSVRRCKAKIHKMFTRSYQDSYFYIIVVRFRFETTTSHQY